MARRLKTRSSALGPQLTLWMISFIIHVVLLLVLSLIEFAPPPERREMIKLRTDFAPEVQRIRPLKKRDVFSETQQAQRATAAATLGAQSALLSKDVPVMTVSGSNIGSRIAGLFETGGAGAFDFGGRSGGKTVADVTKTDPQTYEEVLDEFATDAIKAVKRKKLLVVLLVDESMSIFDDRKAISMKIDSIIKTLKEETNKRELGRLKWAMVSFGGSAKVQVRPSTNLLHVKGRIMGISLDTSGQENLLKAIRYTLKTFHSKEWSLFIAAVTDEVGDDTMGPAGAKMLDQTVLDLRATKTKFYVFGREANFSYHQMWTPIYDLDGRIVDYNWSHAGTETPLPEVLPFHWRFNYNIKSIPSGFGMYTLAYLSYHSGGEYFILSDAPSRYNEDRLEKDYAPEMIPRSAYEQRQKDSKIRRVMDLVCKEWQRKMWVTIWFSRLDRLDGDAQAQIQKAAEAYKWLRDARRALASTKTRDKSKRWRAHRDLTVAQLAKNQFQIRQYMLTMTDVLKKGWPFPKKGQPYTHFSIVPLKYTDKPPGGRTSRRELREAQKLLTEVAEKYKGLPWGTLAERDLKTLTPYRITWGYYERRERKKQ